MKLNLLYDELNEIIINRDNNYIKMMSFESSTRSSLIAAFEGIYNTITIILQLMNLLIMEKIKKFF